MPFYDNENLTRLNVELWIIPILILIILLYLSRTNKYRRFVLVISILYILFLFYQLYLIFLPLLTLKGTLFYFVEFPYGFTFLALTIFLILSLFFAKKGFSIAAFILLLIVSFNQIYLRIETSKMNNEYEKIVDGNNSSNVFTVQIDTTDSYYSNSFGFDSTFWHHFSIVKTMKFTPYLAIDEKNFFYFDFPNYYWTKYFTYDKQSRMVQIEKDFIKPKLIEKFKLKTKSKIDKFYVIYKIDKNGTLLNVIGTYPDSISFINKAEYLNSIKFMPAYLNNVPIDLTYFKKYVQ